MGHGFLRAVVIGVDSALRKKRFRAGSVRDTARAMSQENAELLRAAFENFLAGKSDFGAELLDPEVEWDASDNVALDIGGVYQGPEGVRQFWRDWLAAWDTVQFEYELVDAGDRVVALIDQRMRGRSTGSRCPSGSTPTSTRSGTG